MEPGARVAGRYDVVRELGRGAMATVYLAHDIKFGAPVALKIAPALRANAYDEFKARFVREARIGYLLGRQDGFVRALDWGDLPGGDLYLAADLVPDAAPLDLRAGLRPVAERLGVLLRAAELVGRSHAHGVVHRDIKPANFLVSGEGALYLTDFGMAKVLADHDAEHDILGYTLRTGRDVYMGTPQFMPPEQFESPAEVDARADIYALGVMLFHCVTGCYPFQARSGVEIICKHLAVRDGEEPGPRPRDIDPRIDATLDDLCASALAMDPAERPQTVADFIDWLSRSSEVDAPLDAVRPSFLAAMQRTRAVPGLDGPADVPRRPLGVDPGRLIAGALDSDGFATRDTLNELRRRLGHQAFRTLLGAAPALIVQNEREFQGGRWYLGRVGLLRRRDGVAGPPDQITLGRSLEHADLVFELVTISNVQLRFSRRDDHWLVAETGSRNGTELNGVRLEADRPPVRLKDGDVLYVSKHLTLVFHGTESLERWLEER